LRWRRRHLIDLSERLRVLFITPWYPSQAQPIAGVFVRETARAARLRNDVVVLHAVGPESSLATQWQLDEEIDPVLTQGIPTYRLRWRPWPVPPRNYCAHLWTVLAAVRRLSQQGFCPDIIHAHVYPSSAAALMVGKLCRKPVVLTEHSSDFPRRKLSSVYRWSIPFVFRRMNCVMPVSASLQSAIEAYGVTARFQVVPNVVDTELFHPDSAPRGTTTTKHMLFVGGFVPVKGVEYLVRAFALFTGARTGWHLDLVGDGPLKVALENLTYDLAIADKVTFHGLQPKARVAELMRQADLFVLASLWDNAPCVVIEAMASGLPIVASNVGGIPEMVDRTAGKLVPPADEHALAEALTQMDDSLDAFDRQAIAVRARERYSMLAVGGMLDAIYRQAQG
jgi:glycosyltransferase involved in cell wall biosynthesis